jgi:hypothetical protein
LLTCLLTYLLTYLLIYILTYLLTSLLAYLHTYLLSYLLIYILTYIHTNLLTYLLIYLDTNLLTCLLTYILTPWSRILLEKLTGSQLVKEFPVFYGTRKFITAFTSARHLSLSSTSSIQSIVPHPTSWRSILILLSHLRLGYPSDPFPYQNPVYPSPLPPTRYMPSTSHFSTFYHPNNIVWAVQIIQLFEIRRSRTKNCTAWRGQDSNPGSNRMKHWYEQHRLQTFRTLAAVRNGLCFVLARQW